jgi:hypothetical protein
VKASITNVQTKVGDATQLNFDLRKTSGAKTVGATGKKKHKVWIAAETGSNIGGRWVEVEDGQDRPNSTTVGADPVGKAGNTAIRGFQMGSR